MVVAELVLGLRGALPSSGWRAGGKRLLVDEVAKRREAEAVDGPAAERAAAERGAHVGGGALARECGGSGLGHPGGAEHQEHAGQEHSAPHELHHGGSLHRRRIGSAGEEADRHDRARRRSSRCPPRRAAAGRSRDANGAHRGRLAVALDAPRPPQHRQQPAPRPLPRAATGPGASAPARACSARPVVAPTRPSTRARPTPGSTPRSRRPAALALQDRRDHRLGRGARRGHVDLRLGRRAHLPAAHRRAPAEPPRSARSGASGPRASRPRASS